MNRYALLFATEEFSLAVEDNMLSDEKESMRSKKMLSKRRVMWKIARLRTVFQEGVQHI